jgi:hypothetical protein
MEGNTTDKATHLDRNRYVGKLLDSVELKEGFSSKNLLSSNVKFRSELTYGRANGILVTALLFLLYPPLS